MLVDSVTRLGDFYKFCAINCVTKSIPNILVTFGLFIIRSLICKKCEATFGQLLRGKLGNFLFHRLVTLLVEYNRRRR